MATASSAISEQNDEWYTTRRYEAFNVTIAAPAVFTKDYHGLLRNDRIKLFTTGALPSGLTADTFYYVIPLTAHTFSLATVRDGTAITTTGTQSGAHSYAADKQQRIIPRVEDNR